MPVFEGLLPSPHNEMVLDLLFVLATWHAYTKLRLHTSTTLQKLQNVTKMLGSVLRRFSQTTCEAYQTRELPQEEAAWGCHQAAMAAKEGPSGRHTQPTKGSKLRKLNLCTYKLHALGDYVNTIREFGTTDNYTMQVVCPSLYIQKWHTPDKYVTKGELEHRRVKCFYSRTNKQRFISQITKHQRRKQLLQRICQQLAEKASSDLGLPVNWAGMPRREFLDVDELAYTKPEAHYHISASKKNFENVTSFLLQHRNERALEVRPILWSPSYSWQR